MAAGSNGGRDPPPAPRRREPRAAHAPRGLQGNLEALLDGVYPPDEAHIGPILDETRVLERLIDDLRTLSLAESGALPLHRETDRPVGAAGGRRRGPSRPRRDHEGRASGGGGGGAALDRHRSGPDAPGRLEPRRQRHPRHARRGLDHARCPPRRRAPRLSRSPTMGRASPGLLAARVRALREVARSRGSASVWRSPARSSLRTAARSRPLATAAGLRRRRPTAALPLPADAGTKVPDLYLPAVKSPPRRWGFPATCGTLTRDRHRRSDRSPRARLPADAAAAAVRRRAARDRARDPRRAARRGRPRDRDERRRARADQADPARRRTRPRSR